MRTTAVMVVALLLAGFAQAHGERRAGFPPGDGEVPEYRDHGPYLLTCKDDTPARIADDPFAAKLQGMLHYAECAAHGHEHIQGAVNAVPHANFRILLMPGLYQEEPSVAALDDPACEDAVNTKILEYDEQLACPNAHNTVAIFGDTDGDGRCTEDAGEVLCNLQIEGIGQDREDVILDTNWHHLNALRADRADGIYLKHFTAQRTDFNSVYILEVDGFVIDDVLTRWNFEYGFLTFAVDHGLYVDCESYGNGDSGIYPGSASDLSGARHSIEIKFCDSHHNALGYSGTAGNSVYAHHNKFHHNAVGVATDSLFPDHPGLPQDHARFYRNEIYSNNENYFDNWLPDGPCHKPLRERGIENGTVCPVIPLPVGSGLMIAGGNDNTIQENWIYDNHRYGTMLFGVPAYFRGEDDPTNPDTVEKQLDTSHRNQYQGNWMGLAGDGLELPNGRDHWWDESGSGNCWVENHYVAGGMQQEDTDFTLVYPECGVNDPLNGQYRPPHARLLTIVPCNDYSWPDNTHPDGCDWMTKPEAP